MMVMTAKVDLKKILAALAAAAAVVLALVVLLGGGDQETAATAAPAAGSNDARVEFLKSFGWEVTTSPTESSQVKIPTDPDPVFQRYNALQKGQGYDLSQLQAKRPCAMSTKWATIPVPPSRCMPPCWYTRGKSSAATLRAPPPAAKFRASSAPKVRPRPPPPQPSQLLLPCPQPQPHSHKHLHLTTPAPT